MVSLSFLYITQTAAGLPSIYDCLRKKNLVLLSYKQQGPDTTLFLPNSTWTTGRNALREHVLALETKYDYYVFLDEDVVFQDYSQEEGFTQLEALVEKYKPDIATPYYNWEHNQIIPGAAVQTATWYDGLCNVFSKESLLCNNIFPYIDTFDKECWWTSQYIMIILCAIHKKELVLFNTLRVLNTNHATYPQGNNGLVLAKEYVLKMLLNNESYNWDTKILKAL